MRVITLGTLDLLHAGHLDLLRMCRNMGYVIVGLNTDEFVEKYKGKKPVMSYEERKDMLEAVGLVDEIVANDQSSGSAKELIKASGADVIIVGSDWARKDYVGQLGLDWDWLEENGIGIYYYPRKRKMSTTLIKGRI